MDLFGVHWFKSSYCGDGNNGANCVEVSFLPDARVGVRDTKDRARPAQTYPANEWAAFLTAIRAGEFST